MELELLSPNRLPPHRDKAAFELAVEQLQAQAANLGTYLSLDASVRRAYAQHIAAMAAELRTQVGLGQLTWKQAAEQANEMRNVIMDTMRGRSSPYGRAMAEKLKAEGKTVNELIARKTRQLHGAKANYAQLSATQKNAVYAAIVQSAGESNPRVTLNMQRLSHAGRGLLILSLAISVYNISTAEDKLQAAKREAAVTGAGVAGGMLGGALAGLACGPGAPVCVTVGAFVGGAAAALGVSLFW